MGLEGVNPNPNALLINANNSLCAIVLTKRGQGPEEVVLSQRVFSQKVFRLIEEVYDTLPGRDLVAQSHPGTDKRNLPVNSELH